MAEMPFHMVSDFRKGLSALLRQYVEVGLVTTVPPPLPPKPSTHLPHIHNLTVAFNFFFFFFKEDLRPARFLPLNPGSIPLTWSISTSYEVRQAEFRSQFVL